MTGVSNLHRKQQALTIAARLAKQAGASMSGQKDGVSEARRLALDLESISDDLDQLDSLKRRQQPAGALR